MKYLQGFLASPTASATGPGEAALATDMGTCEELVQCSLSSVLSHAYMEVP